MPQPCHNWISTYYHHLGLTNRIIGLICTNFYATLPDFRLLPEFKSLLLRQKKVRNFGLFSCFGALSTQTSTQTASQRFDEALHLFGAVPHHRGRYMCILIHRESGGGMPHVVGNGFYIDPVLQRQRGIGVPLWYNRKKRRSPYFTRGCAVCRCEISPFPALKWQRKICPGKEVCYANTKKQAK